MNGNSNSHCVLFTKHIDIPQHFALLSKQLGICAASCCSADITIELSCQAAQHMLGPMAYKKANALMLALYELILAS